jgi:hypothetical protein
MYLIHLASFAIKFTIVFTITSILLTIKHFFFYLSKMFDLPTDIITSLVELDKTKNEDKNKEV